MGVGVPGLIPAHAGKTLACHARRNDQRAHPRSRGENIAPPPLDSACSGSSPLTRGKPGTPVGQTLATRLIPAHAGKT